MGVGRLITASPQTLTGRLRAARECVLWVLRQRTRHRVVNASMMPTAQEGDYLLVNPRAYLNRQPVPGELVLACHPDDANLIITKRVAGIADNRVELVSDNQTAGQDSRHFGPLPMTSLRGQVTAVIR